LSSYISIMKKNYWIIIAVFIFSWAHGQDEDPLYTRAGFKMGINYANVTGDFDNTDARIRMHLGAVVEFPVTQRFFIQAELLYAAQGYKIEEDGIENKISLNYLSLPIITKFYVAPRFSLETGPRFASLSNATESKENSSDEFFNTYENVDIGWNFGVGYKAESGMFLQLHYVLGMRNIINTETVDASVNNTLMQLSIGYLFKTKNNRRPQSGE